MCYCTTSISAPWCNQCGPINNFSAHPVVSIPKYDWCYPNKYIHPVDSETAARRVVDAAFAFGEAKKAFELADNNLENARLAFLEMTKTTA